MKVIHEGIGIDRGSITTLHDLTNTQTIVDAPHKDLRRARAAGMSLIPTTTGSATAIGLIFPELQGKLDGLAVRVPLLNASLTDCVFEVARPTTVEEVNGLLRAAADGPLAGILGYEERPLVSIDFKDDPRSGIVDALSTMVTDGTQVKILAWYDNEWGYANRLVELARIVAASLATDAVSERATAAPQGDLRNYVLVTAAYWADTIADGAIRILVLFYFYELGYTPFQLATLFVFYEIFGIITNLVGGFLAARFGLKTTLVMGLVTQILALLMLGLAPDAWLVVPLRDGRAGALGDRQGPDEDELQERRQVRRRRRRARARSTAGWRSSPARRTRSRASASSSAACCSPSRASRPRCCCSPRWSSRALVLTVPLMHGDLGRADRKAKFKHMFSNNRAVNILAAARVFLFASRDVWFVVGLPVYLRTVLGWSFWQVGTFLAIWVIGYGIVQASAPRFVRRRSAEHGAARRPDRHAASPSCSRRSPPRSRSRSAPTSTRRS